MEHGLPTYPGCGPTQGRVDGLVWAWDESHSPSLTVLGRLPRQGWDCGDTPLYGGAVPPPLRVSIRREREVHGEVVGSCWRQLVWPISCVQEAERGSDGHLPAKALRDREDFHLAEREEQEERG